MILSKSNQPDPTPPPMLPNMMNCPDCGTLISKQANSCPKCGRAIQASVGNVVWRVLFILIVLGGLGAILQKLASG